jgi:Domain of unknown function (DUF1707)
MAAPGDDGRLRAGHADRERAVKVLKAAFVQGRLTKAEFDLRISQALASRTYADLGAVTADLPAVPVTAATLQPAGDPANRTVAKVIASITAVWVTFWVVVATVIDPGALPSLQAYLLFAFTMFAGIPGTPAALLMLHAWMEKRGDSQSPQGLPPTAGVHAAQRAVPGHPGRKLPPPGPRHTTYRSALAS